MNEQMPKFNQVPDSVDKGNDLNNKKDKKFENLGKGVRKGVLALATTVAALGISEKSFSQTPSKNNTEISSSEGRRSPEYKEMMDNIEKLIKENGNYKKIVKIIENNGFEVRTSRGTEVSVLELMEAYNSEKDKLVIYDMQAPTMNLASNMAIVKYQRYGVPKFELHLSKEINDENAKYEYIVIMVVENK